MSNRTPLGLGSDICTRWSRFDVAKSLTGDCSAMPLVSRTKPPYTPVQQSHLPRRSGFLKDVSRPDQVAGVLAIFRGHVDRLFGIAPRHLGTGGDLHELPLGRRGRLLELGNQVIVAKICPSLVAMSILQDHDIGRNDSFDGCDIMALQRLLELLNDALDPGLIRTGSNDGSRKGDQ